MSVKTQIDRLTSAKSAIKSAIEGKGVSVPASTKLDGMATLITSINPTYSVVNTLFGCTVDNAAQSAIKGQSYCAYYTANDGYQIEAVTVLMGGVDITDEVWFKVSTSKGAIAITEVTGNIVITAIAIMPYTCKNVARTGIGTDGQLYNGTGYKDNTKLGDGGALTSFERYTTTGYIKVTPGTAHILRFGGTVQPNWNEYGHYLVTYDSSFKVVRECGYGVWSIGGDYQPAMSTEDGCTYKMSLPSGLITSKVAYIRLSVKTTLGSVSAAYVTGAGAGLVIALDEKLY